MVWSLEVLGIDRKDLKDAVVAEKTAD